MEVKINIKKWKIVQKEDKSKTIGGVYSVMCGPNQVAESSFNDGYQSTDIPIPSELLVKIEALDKEIKEVIINNFTG